MYTPDIDRERWLLVRLAVFELDVLVVHIPGAQDHKFADQHAISGTKRKQLLWERTIKYAVEHQECRAIIIGDFNTGFRIDAEGEMFAMSHYMAKLIDTGFIDSWRHLHQDIRDYTWYSKRKDKTTGTSHDLNGFRLDYIFISPALQHTINAVRILHDPRRAGASDHASVVADIDMLRPADAPPKDEPQRSEVVETVKPEDQPADKVIAANGKLRARFDLPPETLPDMPCGVNGQDFVQPFRPTYVTAEWTGGVLKEVRIWGPRVLQDGSLGKRLLDHVWKKPVAAGGVKYRDLPSPVAERLRSYTTDNGLGALPR